MEDLKNINKSKIRNYIRDKDLLKTLTNLKIKIPLKSNKDIKEKRNKNCNSYFKSNKTENNSFISLPKKNEIIIKRQRSLSKINFFPDISKKKNLNKKAISNKLPNEFRAKSVPKKEKKSLKRRNEQKHDNLEEKIIFAVQEGVRLSMKNINEEIKKGIVDGLKIVNQNINNSIKEGLADGLKEYSKLFDAKLNQMNEILSMNYSNSNKSGNEEKSHNGGNEKQENDISSNFFGNNIVEDINKNNNIQINSSSSGGEAENEKINGKKSLPKNSQNVGAGDN